MAYDGKRLFVRRLTNAVLRWLRGDQSASAMIIDCRLPCHPSAPFAGSGCNRLINPKAMFADHALQKSAPAQKKSAARQA